MAQYTKSIPISAWSPAWSSKKKRHVPGVVPIDAELYDILYKIKDGGYKDIVLPLREITDPEQRKQYKTEKLPAITVSGQFRKPREERSLIAHSGLLCIDIDPAANPDITDWPAARDKMIDQTPCVAGFLSCSGKGVAIIVKIDPQRHKETFDYIAWELAKDGTVIDPAPKNVVSLRFVSFDPEAYIDPDYDNINQIVPSPEFLEHKKEVDAKLREVRQQAKPVTSSNDIELFQNAKAEADAKGMKLVRGLGTPLIQFMVWYCNSRGMSKETCIQFFLQHYGTTDYYTEESITERITDMYERYEDQHGTIPLEREKAGIEISFFDISKAKKKLIIQLNRGRFIDFLHSRGVRLFLVTEQSYRYIKLSGWTFEEITIEQVKKIVQQHINSLPEKFDCGLSRGDLMEFLYKGSDNYFSKSFFEFIDRFNPDFLKDTQGEAFFPFRNGIVCITADKIELRGYDDIKKHLWKNSIINHDIVLDNYDLMGSVWYRFLSCISGNDDPTKLTSEQTDNFFYLKCLTGYLLHRYKDQARPWAGILAEATDTEDRGGGTGKGLYCKGLEKVLSVCLIPGKTFDPQNRFAWQGVELHNSIIVIDDVPQKFTLEGLYNTITEGINIERKGQQLVFIPYENSPKIIVISNYVISSTGNHAARRQKIFEFAQFFSPKYTPEQHFGHILFNNWDQQEWNRFYNTQISCVMMYLKNGLRESVKSETLKRREVRQKYGPDFERWFYDEYLKNGCETWQGVSDLHNDFLSFADTTIADYSVKRFRSGIQSATLSTGHKILSERRPIVSEGEEKPKKKNMVRIEKKNIGQDRQ